jgi:hypothetical protein
VHTDIRRFRIEIANVENEWGVPKVEEGDSKIEFTGQIGPSINFMGFGFSNFGSAVVSCDRII